MQIEFSREVNEEGRHIKIGAISRATRTIDDCVALDNGGVVLNCNLDDGTQKFDSSSFVIIETRHLSNEITARSQLVISDIWWPILHKLEPSPCLRLQNGHLPDQISSSHKTSGSQCIYAE